MRTIIATFALIGVVSTAHASDATRKAAEKAAQKMMVDATVYIAVAYLCRNALGTSYYYAARSAAEDAAWVGGKSKSDAVIMVDEIDKQIKADILNSLPAMKMDRQKCLDKLLETQTAFRVSKAHFEKAAAAVR